MIAPGIVAIDELNFDVDISQIATNNFRKLRQEWFYITLNTVLFKWAVGNLGTFIPVGELKGGTIWHTYSCPSKLLHFYCKWLSGGGDNGIAPSKW